MRQKRRASFAVVAAACLLLLLVVLLSHNADDASLWSLPYLAARSVLRMVIAFALSTVFAIVYGYTAATSKRAGRVLLPLLDILQSVPILGFFPAAVLFFVGLFRGSILGLELASVFLIFTSQCWNMAFGVYEAITTMPMEAKDAADVVGARGWMRVKRVTIPATIPKLVYNGIVSWAGGWYFVTASEIISTNTRNTVLPGLGSFLFRAGVAGDLTRLGAGIAVLVVVVVLFEFLLWRPMQVLAERFKFESVRSTVKPRSMALEFYHDLRRPQPSIPILASPVRLPPRPARRERKGLLRATRLTLTVAFAAAFLFLVGLLAYNLVLVLLKPLPGETASIPLAMLASTLRLLIAYLITLAWTVPAAIYIARHEKASRFLLPLTEVLASMPAAALFPLIVLLLVGPSGGLMLPSILLVLTGMQWYLLFNLIAGARLIPNDLLAAAEIQGVKGWLLWKRVLLPGMMPALVTGSITAWGGGWNALIVSEYVHFGSSTYHTFGIGYLLDKATFETHDGALLLLSVLAMVAFIYALNLAFWKPVYRKVMAKYRLEGAT